jgi:Domain of unknown function (DUF4282)
MSTPPEPGRPPYPDGSGQPGGPRPSGPPPRPTGPGPGPQPSGPGRPGPDQPPQGWVPQPRPAEPESTGKSFLGVLLDTDFEHLITPKLIKLFYALSIVLITLSSLILLAFGIWVFQYGWLLALAAFVFTPLYWLLGVILVRIFMEAVIVRFKSAEHLHAIKDRGGMG